MAKTDDLGKSGASLADNLQKAAAKPLNQSLRCCDGPGPLPLWPRWRIGGLLASAAPSRPVSGPTPWSVGSGVGLLIMVAERLGCLGAHMSMLKSDRRGAEEGARRRRWCGWVAGSRRYRPGLLNGRPVQPPWQPSQRGLLPEAAARLSGGGARGTALPGDQCWPRRRLDGLPTTAAPSRPLQPAGQGPSERPFWERLGGRLEGKRKKRGHSPSATFYRQGVNGPCCMRSRF